VNGLFMACSALFMGLLGILFIWPVPARTAFDYDYDYE